MKTVKIPGFLRELHGELALLPELVLVYLMASAAGILTWFTNASLSLIPRILAALILADVAGGVVANFTPSTRLYYRDRPRLRPVFLALHVLHILALVWAFPGEWSRLVWIGACAIGGSFLLLSRRLLALRPALALGFTVTGILPLGLSPVPPSAVLLFIPLFGVKLLAGFSLGEET